MTNCCDSQQIKTNLTAGYGSPKSDCNTKTGDMYLDLKSRNVYTYVNGRWTLEIEPSALGSSRIFVLPNKQDQDQNPNLTDGVAVVDGNFVSQPFDIIVELKDTEILFHEQNIDGSYKTLNTIDLSKIATDNLKTINGSTEIKFTNAPSITFDGIISKLNDPNNSLLSKNSQYGDYGNQADSANDSSIYIFPTLDVFPSALAKTGWHGFCTSKNDATSDGPNHVYYWISLNSSNFGNIDYKLWFTNNIESSNKITQYYTNSQSLSNDGIMIIRIHNQTGTIILPWGILHYLQIQHQWLNPPITSLEFNESIYKNLNPLTFVDRQPIDNDIVRINDRQ